MKRLFMHGEVLKDGVKVETKQNSVRYIST